MNSTKIIDTASAAVANLIPAITGLTGNIAIASAGAIVAPIIQSGVSEIAHQILGNLQRKKVLASANITCETIIQNLDMGKQLRNDDFFKFHHNSIVEENESPASKLFDVFSSKVFFYLLKFRKALFFSCFTKNIYTFAQNTKK